MFLFAAADPPIHGSMTDDPAWSLHLQAAAARLVEAWTWTAFAYTITLQLAFAAMVILSRRALSRERPSTRPARRAELLASADPLGVSIVMPAHNEAAGIIHGVRAMQQITYPLFEVIVVNDGSTDRTLERLIETFDLYPIEAGDSPFPELTTNPVRAVWVPRDPTMALRVIDKEPGRTKAYSVNAGVAAAVYPYVVVCDADSLVSPDAVTMVMAEITTRDAVLGAGGTVLPVNDSHVEDGRVIEPRVPRKFLAACQLAEYLRSFVIGRSAFGALDSMALISGAFGVFRRADLLRVGGYASGHLGEDLDLAVRLQRRAAADGRPVGLIQVPEAILWTEVPESLPVLRRQRVRWQRGLIQVIREHARTVGNPAYGRFGVVGMGYLFAFEYLAPIVEMTGYVTLVAAVWLGLLDATTAALLLGMALLTGFANTALAVFIAESRFRLYTRRGDIIRLLAAGALEQVGYRQITVWWRLRAIFSRARRHTWGIMTRKGHDGPAVMAPRRFRRAWRRPVIATGPPRHGYRVWMLAASALGIAGVAAVSVPTLRWQHRDPIELRVTIMDKTTGDSVRREHAGAIWVLEHAKVTTPATGQAYTIDDYYGPTWPVAPEGPVAVRELPETLASDLVYVTDTYGVYKNRDPRTQMVGDPSDLRYGGLPGDELDTMIDGLTPGGTFIAEFNTVAGPTDRATRNRLQDYLGIRWTGWAARHFSELEVGASTSDLPRWVAESWAAQTGRPWPYSGSGWVYAHEDGGVLVLAENVDIAIAGVDLRFTPGAQARYGASASTTYDYWFDVIEADADTQVEATYHLDVTPSGAARLANAGLPVDLPAMVRSERPDGGLGFYFAGDWADQGVEAGVGLGPVGADGIPAWQRLTHRPGRDEQRTFFWKVYQPVLNTIVHDTADRLARTGEVR